MHAPVEKCEEPECGQDGEPQPHPNRSFLANNARSSRYESLDCAGFSGLAHRLTLFTSLCKIDVLWEPSSECSEIAVR